MLFTWLLFIFGVGKFSLSAFSLTGTSVADKNKTGTITAITFRKINKMSCLVIKDKRPFHTGCHEEEKWRTRIIFHITKVDTVRPGFCSSLSEDT